ncbi:hypothetical protein [Adonisia turfae]|uniref:Uncharacterized protein n=1 Tax=Adonisia turfae CCMR0081 TaxID=2292702 RepID=A0A6M0RNF0_9CYAN|nr:hypothetical protein [Adonisia turfae]NEZ57696.1 hypothetical protein [Adonisia turfae CCMR0081]
MQLFDLTSYPYASARPVMLGTRGAVATSQPLAAATGAEILRRRWLYFVSLWAAIEQVVPKFTLLS